uniref:UPL7 n=1 Tax=Arundo donax TaxID=35708 RepID=A0A0A9CW30_ARUDO
MLQAYLKQHKLNRCKQKFLFLCCGYARREVYLALSGKKADFAVLFHSCQV